MFLDQIMLSYYGLFSNGVELNVFANASAARPTGNRRMKTGGYFGNIAPYSGSSR
jgi:hypothetical protein